VDSVLDKVGDGLGNAFSMAFEVWWALVLGFLLSGIVQAWVSRERMESLMGGRGLGAALRATGLGAASSSCSYAAVAIAKSAFEKGAGLPAALAFMFASTNLVFELGIVLWIFIGPAFTAAEFVGGFVLILLMWLATRRFVSRDEEEAARRHAEEAEIRGHVHVSASHARSWREQLASVEAWSDVAHNFRGDWQMLWREIIVGFVLAGFIALLGMDFFNALFITDAPSVPRTLENVVVGPIIAVLSFVCSIGNVPLAAVLWAGGISFSGVVAFIFADLITLPIILIYRKYYGTRFALKLVAIMFATMVVAAILVDLVFAGLGVIPSHRPSIHSIAARGISFNYTAVLNIVFTLVFVALISLTMRRGAKDPVCGMTVDSHTTEHVSEHAGRTYFFCSAGCRAQFESNPERYGSARAPVSA
jgi:uncharacterized protein